MEHGLSTRSRLRGDAARTARGRDVEPRVGQLGLQRRLIELRFVARARRVQELDDRRVAEPIGGFGHVLKLRQALPHLRVEAREQLLALLRDGLAALEIRAELGLRQPALESGLIRFDASVIERAATSVADRHLDRHSEALTRAERIDRLVVIVVDGKVGPALALCDFDLRLRGLLLCARRNERGMAIEIELAAAEAA